MLTKIPEGTVIIREGEKNMDMYKIISGHVELYTGYGTEDESILGIKAKGEYFGEMGLFTEGKPALYTVVAFSDVLLLRVTSADIDEFILENHSDVLRIMKNMASSMYSLKYGMDMVMEDMETKYYNSFSDKKDNNANDYNVHRKQFTGFYSKMFAKYNAGKMMDPMESRNSRRPK